MSDSDPLSPGSPTPRGTPSFDDACPWGALYPAGLVRRADVPVGPLWGLLRDAAQADPDGVAFTYDGRTTSRARLWDAALAWAAAYRAGGALRGDRVALVLPNGPTFLAAFQGALAAGLVVTALSPAYTPHEWVPMLGDAEPRFVVTDPTLRDAAAAAIRSAGIVATLLVADAAAADAGVAAVFPGAPRPQPEPVPDPRGTTAVLQYTSGTTGGVKAAEMSHANLVANAWQNAAWFRWTEADVVLGALPLCHTWGMGCVMHSSFLARTRIALLPAFDPEAVLDRIARDRVSVAYGSATMFHRLLDVAGDRAAAAFRPLRYVKAGAMLVGGDLYARWRAAVPDVPMVNGYGLTEASPEVTNNPPDAPRAGTVGVPLPGTELRLCDPDAPTRVVPRGDEGEVQVRGPQVMRGYWRQPDATSRALLPDGWLRTGDLAAFDDAGYLVIRDRLKDLIKFRGWSVVPGEVERALREHAAVEEACVVGAPDPRDGEVPVAYLVLRPGAAVPSDAEWDAHLSPRLARVKQPRRFVVVPEIPKNHVGKPLRRVLRERATRS